jgi:hypothetical protein
MAALHGDPSQMRTICNVCDAVKSGSGPPRNPVRKEAARLFAVKTGMHQPMLSHGRELAGADFPVGKTLWYGDE